MRASTRRWGESATELKVIPVEREQSYLKGDFTRDDILVPWLYRTIDIRAKAISSLPLVVSYRGKQTDESKIPGLRTALYVIEQSLCSYGRAYAIVDGRVLRALSPLSIRPEVNEQNGLTGFTRTVGTSEVKLTPRDVAWVFLPSCEQEAGWGIAPAQAALSAARVAYQANDYLAAFFERGAIGTTILTIEGNPPQADVERLENWWRRVVSGVKNAFGQVAVRANVKPVVVGNSVRELDIQPVLDAVRNQICAAMGVPQTLLEDAANYATAKEHRRSFYEETIIPEAGLIEEGLNRYLARFGYQIQFDPTSLEMFQQDESVKANAVALLIDRGVITVNEAREWMGFAPLEQSQVDESAPQIDESLATEARFVELKKWREVAKKSPERARAFKTQALPAHVSALVRLGLEAGLEPFALKAMDKMRDKREKQLTSKIQDVLSKYRDDIAAAIEEQANIEDVLAPLRDELKATLGPELAQAVYEGVVYYATTTVAIFDPAVVNTRALDWARNHVSDLAAQLDDTNRKAVQAAVSKFIETPGMTRQDLVNLLEPSFGAYRAEMIATTEVTYAYSASSGIYVDTLREAGIEAHRRWLTAEDEMVCPICGELNGKPEEEWDTEPPAHVNCRCGIGIEV